jgi:hypothetical protein
VKLCWDIDIHAFDPCPFLLLDCSHLLSLEVSLYPAASAPEGPGRRQGWFTFSRHPCRGRSRLPAGHR